ncbi:hypothetical protein CLCR_07052 [Cladophialophora carrionii]|uniref:Uncharacterized protein n=1 Tax=Cladophialophora carrionii TaxID=86049 RepID=A0A1C1CMY8_9EURO|nr:hypothetical protein CLCR_07052 [Cladophialophora carrionii]
MDKKNPNWGSVRSKLTQEGYMYRMKLGNPPTGSDKHSSQQRPPSSISSSKVQLGLPAGDHAFRPVPSSALDPDRAAVELRTISGLLVQLNLGRAFRSDHHLDPNAAIEFLYRCFAPFVIHRRNESIGFEPGDFLDPVMLEDNMLAQALVVWTSEMRDRFSPEPESAGELLLAHRSTVLHELRERISSSGRCTSDPVMWTILMLAATELVQDNMQAMGTHLGALRHIIYLRGGVNSTSSSEWVKLILLQFEGFLNYRQFDRVRSAGFGDASSVAQHTHCPFPPEFKDRMAKLPPGFTEIFGVCPMNLHVLSLIERIHQWTQQLADLAQVGQEGEAVESIADAMSLDSFRAFDLLQQDRLRATERLLVLGLCAFCIYMNGRIVYSVMEWALRLHCMAQVTKQMNPFEEDVRRSMIWVATVLMATGGNGSPSWQLGGRIIRACRGAHSPLQAIARRNQRSYFWHANLTEKLTAAALRG